MKKKVFCLSPSNGRKLVTKKYQTHDTNKAHSDATADVTLSVSMCKTPFRWLGLGMGVKC